MCIKINNEQSNCINRFCCHQHDYVCPLTVVCSTNLKSASLYTGNLAALSNITRDQYLLVDIFGSVVIILNKNFQQIAVCLCWTTNPKETCICCEGNHWQLDLLHSMTQRHMLPLYVCDAGFSYLHTLRITSNLAKTAALLLFCVTMPLLTQRSVMLWYNLVMASPPSAQCCVASTNYTTQNCQQMFHYLRVLLLLVYSFFPLQPHWLQESICHHPDCQTCLSMQFAVWSLQ